MPREQRKRGKKHKEKHDLPSNVVENRNKKAAISIDQADDFHTDSPFGHVDPDVKAYFKTVDDQLKEWQTEGIDVEIDVEMDPNEQRRMFFAAALSEMNNKEIQLATDPECSVILERMLYSMDDFARRVFTDSLTGSWVNLIKDRFASHVCQTLLTLAIDTIHRESKGVVSSVPVDPQKGQLLQMTQFVLDICENILPELTDLMQDQFASHVIRALLVLLCPSGVFISTESYHSPSTRSKKSAQWKAKKGEMKSIVLDTADSGSYLLFRPKSFMEMAKRFLDHIGQILGGNEVRALAIDKAASPLLQMFLELESHLEQSDKPNSIMDYVLVGLISKLHEGNDPSSSDYVVALLMDSTSSHLAETLIRLSPTLVFTHIWKLYFIEDISRLASHPVANFVVSRAILKLSVPDLIEANGLLTGTWKKCLKTARLGPLISLINRAGYQRVLKTEVLQIIRDIFDLSHTTDLGLLVLCVVRLKPRSDYLKFLKQKQKVDKQVLQPEMGYEDGHGATMHTAESASLEPKVQGSLLLQAMLTLPEPQNEVVLESLCALEPSALLAFASHPISSRVIDAIFQSSSAVNLRLKKKVVTAFIDQIHLLIDDRIGSRVADHLWTAADPYLKEKIARSLLPHEQFLAGSKYAHFFTRKINLSNYKNHPRRWNEALTKGTGKRSSVNAIPVSTSRTTSFEDLSKSKVVEQEKSSTKKRKGDVEIEDEIDAVFNKVKRPKFSRLEAVTGVVSSNKEASTSSLDTSVLAAIKGAPRTEEKRSGSKSKKKKK